MFTLLEATPSSAIDFAPIIFGIVAVLGLIGALKGFTRGISRQLVRTITIVASFIISLILAKGIYTGLCGFLSDKTMADVEQLLIQYGVLSGEADNSWLHSIDIDTIMLILTLPLSLVIMPIAFVTCFMTLSGILHIVHAILCAIFGFRKRGNNILSRAMGMALGLLQGVAVAGLVLMPVIGISTVVSESIAIIEEQSSQENASSEQVVKLYDDYVKSIAENPTTKTLGACGINKVYKSIATVEIDGKQTDMTELIPDIAVIVGKVTSLKGIDIKNLTPENEATITEIFDTVEENTYLTSVIAGAVKTFSYTYTNGVIGINADPTVTKLLDSAVSIFHSTDSANIHADIDTVCDVFFILSRDGVLASFDSGSANMMSALTKRDENGVTTVKKVIEVINKNERTKPLIGMLTDLSISVMRETTGLDESSIAVGNNLKASINEKTMKINRTDYASEEEYVAAVSASLDETLKENNINLDKGVVDNMAKYITENYGDKSEISDEEANDILLYYFDAYLEHSENQAQS